MPQPIVVSADRWRSTQHTTLCATRKLTTGLIVIAGRRPFRIASTHELPFEDWPDKYVAQWEKEGRPPRQDWHNRPYRVEGLWEEPGASDRLHAATAPSDSLWNVLPEHFAVCRLCHELPPCTHIHNECITARASERLDRHMAILPGSCHACLEPISKRQKSFTFPGPNLIRPDLGDDSAVFHTRSDCYHSLTSYDRQWAAAEEHRSRFFYCEGTQVIHHDDSTECDRPDCTGKGALKSLVEHSARIWHRPGASGRLYTAMREFGRDPGAGHDVCWCLAGAEGAG